MSAKKSESAADVVRTALPEFEVVTKTKSDAAFLPPDGKTAGVKQLHHKYGSDAAVEEAALNAAAPPSSASATQAVVVEPKDRRDASAKRLTVLVKQGKIRAIQG
jgi:hypothetical protein